MRGNKGGNFEGGIRGVGFVCGGQVRNKGTVSRELMHVTDWFPTLVNQAQGNFEGVKPLDGFDQWDAIRYVSILRLNYDGNITIGIMHITFLHLYKPKNQVKPRLCKVLNKSLKKPNLILESFGSSEVYIINFVNFQNN